MIQSTIEIQPIENPIDATITAPGSKSYTNRALLVAALAEGRSRLTGALFSDDTHYMSDSLRRLGVEIDADAEASTFEVVGNGGNIPVNRAELYVGNSGTTARSLVSYVALGRGEFVVDGDAPMRESRPISDLLDALRQLHVDVRSRFNNDLLPLTVYANGIRGGKTQLDASKSSQFLTSLMLSAPYTEAGVEIDIRGEMKTPYIDITMSVMSAFGVNVSHDNYTRFRIDGGQRYQPREYAIEPDASNASYFFAAAALTGGRVRVNGINMRSAQGDIHFVDVLEQMGCGVNRYDDGVEVVGPTQLRGIDIDMKAISDTSLTLAAIAPFAEGKVTIRNIGHTRHQETDRIHAMVTELKKLSVSVVEHADGLEISPSEISPSAIDTYADHRMAMSFALIGLRTPGIRINDPGCVSKTFPTFFDILRELRS